jgi:hypothetical protein
MVELTIAAPSLGLLVVMTVGIFVAVVREVAPLRDAEAGVKEDFDLVGVEVF